jgi:hypothetical protein
MDLNTMLARGDEYVYSQIGDETVMMNVNTGNYASFNETGNLIWSLLDKPNTAKQLIETLSNEYVINSEQLSVDVLPFIEKLLDRKILVKA